MDVSTACIRVLSGLFNGCQLILPSNIHFRSVNVAFKSFSPHLSSTIPHHFQCTGNEILLVVLCHLHLEYVVHRVSNTSSFLYFKKWACVVKSSTCLPGSWAPGRTRGLSSRYKSVSSSRSLIYILQTSRRSHRGASESNCQGKRCPCRRLFGYLTRVDDWWKLYHSCSSSYPLYSPVAAGWKHYFRSRFSE